MSEKIIIAHHGTPCTPAEIPAAGGVVIFAANPLGGPLWLGEATQEQADHLLQYPFFTKYEGETPAFALDGLTLPDDAWTKAGIAEWALEHLAVELDQTKYKRDMLIDLTAAIEAKKAAAVEPTPEVAPDEPKAAE